MSDIQTTTFKGARYIPLFGGTWDRTKAYEALVAVQHNAYTYLSKQPVPKNVDITNTDFWLLWADPNAQMQQLYQEYVDLTEDIEALDENLQNEVSIINNPIYILIGDSYAEGYTPDGNVTSWATLVKNWFNKIGIDCRIFCTGGYGFAGGGFATLLNNAVSDLDADEKKSVKKIIFGGGYNDVGNSLANILSGMNSCASIIKTNFDNVDDVLVYAIGNCVEGKTTGVHSNRTYTQIVSVYRNYVRDAVQCGFRVVNGISLLKNNAYFSSDYVHPNENGQYILADAIFNEINGSEFDLSVYYSEWISSSFNYGDDVAVDSGTFGYSYLLDNDNCTVSFSNAYTIKLTAQISKELSGNIITIPIVKQTAEWQPYNLQKIPCNFVFKYRETEAGLQKYVSAPGKLTINPTNMVIYAQGLSDDHSQFFAMPYLNQITILPQGVLTFTNFQQTTV